ncbi:MAG: hypothetical protein ABIH50_03770 [bacterium]
MKNLHSLCKKLASIKEEKDKQGKIKHITVTSYHCEECNSFIRSEEANDRIGSLLDFVSS